MSQLQAHLSKNGRAEFLDALATSGIEFTRRHPAPGRVSASIETIVIELGVALIGAFASVLIAWVNARASRTVIIQEQNGATRTVTGYSAKDVIALNGAASVTLIDTEKDAT